MKVRLFIKPYCGWCHKAIRWLDDHHIKYETLDVIADAEAFKEMVKLSGQELAPVMDVDGKILADFGPEELVKFWRNRTTNEHEWNRIRYNLFFAVLIRVYYVRSWLKTNDDD